MADDTMMQDAPAAQQPAQPDGGNPDQAIGYIPEEYPAKDKTFLAAARTIILRPETAKALRQILAAGKDPAMSLAMFVGKLVDSIETKLGPLEDDEHDRICLVITGWLVSSLQAMGMPGLDAPEGRQDLLGRVLQRLDGMTQGQPQGGANEAQEPASAAPEPMGQFAGAA